MGQPATVEPVLIRRHPDSEPEPIGVYKSRLEPKRTFSTSIVIPCRLGTRKVIDGKELILLEHCLQAISRSLSATDDCVAEREEVQIVLVLNADDNLAEAEESIRRHHLDGFAICDEPGFDFARKCNLGAQKSSGEILVFLNDDTEMQITRLAS